jgi:hypothetical protein
VNLEDILNEHWVVTDGDNIIACSCPDLKFYYDEYWGVLYHERWALWAAHVSAIAAAAASSVDSDTNRAATFTDISLSVEIEDSRVSFGGKGA